MFFIFCILFISQVKATAMDNPDEVHANSIFPFTLVLKAPNIDGLIEKDEYPTMIDGLIDTSTHLKYPEKSFIATAADNEYLYIGASIEVPDNYKPVSASNMRDDSKQITGGDTFNMFIRNDTDLSSKKVIGHYISIQPNENIYDCFEKLDWLKLDCNRDSLRNYNILTKSSIAGKVWTLEMRIPRKELGLEENHPFSFAAGFRVQSKRYCLADQPIFFDHNEGFAIGIFSKAGVQTEQMSLNQGIVEPALKLTDEYDIEYQGDAVWKLKVPVIREVASGMVLDKHIDQKIEVGTKSSIKEWKEKIKLKSASSIIGLDNKFRLEFPGIYCLDTTLRIQNEIIFNRSLPFLFFEPLEVELQPIPSKDSVKAVFSCYGTAGNNLGKASISFSSGKEYLKLIFPMSTRKETHIFSMAQLVPGKYVVDACLFDQKGEKVAGKSFEFRKWDTPIWLKERKGIEALSSAWVPAPWSPITEGNGIVSTWGRKYMLSKGSLIKQLISQELELLSSEVKIKYLKDGKEHTINTSAPEFPSRDRGRIEAVQNGGSPHFSMNVKQQIEFDGMDRLELAIKPCGKITVSKLWLEIPLKNCNYMYTTGMGYWATGLIRDQELMNPTSIWLGSDNAGLLVFMENYKGWLINSSKPRIVIKRHDTSIILSLLLVNEPSDVEQPLDIVLGLQASPVKPFFAGLRNIRPSGWSWSPPPVNLWMTAPAHWSASYFKPASRNEGILDAMTDYVKKYNQKVYPYCAPTAVSLYNMTSRDTPFMPTGRLPPEACLNEKNEANKIEEYWYFAEDWNTAPAYSFPADTNGRETAQAAKCSFRSSWSDYYAYSIHKILKDSKINGFYFDVPMDLNVQYDERAYYTKDGNLEGTADIFACRDFYKRLYFLFDTMRGEKEKPYILGHGVPAMLPVCSFWDIAFHGEEIKPKAKFEATMLFLQKDLKGNPIPGPAEPEAARDYNAVAYRTLFGTQFGIPHMYLPQYAYVPAFNIKEHSREILSFTFLHNNLLWPAYIPEKPVYEFWDKVEVPFGMGDTIFHPYWNNGIKTHPECIRLSYWKKVDENTYLIAIANWSDKTVQAGIELPEFLTLGLYASDLETGEKASLTKNWAVTVPAHDLRVFMVKKE